VANDYKQDVGKVPLLAALKPFAPALWALARMMDDMQHKHRLAGSSDPFNQWAQLPDAKRRMEGAMGRHLVPEEEGATLWSVNTKDGSHLHITHALFNLLGALTLHIRDNAERCCAAPDASEWEAKAAEDSGSPVRNCFHACGLSDGYCSDCGRQVTPKTPLHAPAGADWRESTPKQPGKPVVDVPRCLGLSPDGVRCKRDRDHPGYHVAGFKAWS